MGVVSGVAFLLLVKAARSGDPSARTTTQFTGNLLAIPTFWFGGPWATTVMLEDVDFDTILSDYTVTLAIAFCVVIAWPVGRWVYRAGLEFGRA